MSGPVVKIQLTHPEAVVPQYATQDAAGADLVVVESAVLAPGQRALLNLGFRMEIPEGYEAQIRPRSGQALKLGLTVLNTPGTIDADFRGDVKILLINHGHLQINIIPGTRVAQMVIARVPQAQFVPVTDLTVSDRGHGGFGHTGIDVQKP